MQGGSKDKKGCAFERKRLWGLLIYGIPLKG